MLQEKPAGYENDLGDYQVLLVDGYCGEAVAWGFPIIKHLGDERFDALRQHGKLEYLGPDGWGFIINTLSREEALEKYGAITEEILGPKGGWKSTTFGNKKFISRSLRPKK